MHARELFEPLLARNPSGSDWLAPLLSAAPHGERLGAAAADPGTLHANITVPGLEGRRTCFGYPVAPPPALIEWYIEHPERLTWAAGEAMSEQARLLRRALLYDEPPGARARAQQRARQLVPVRSAFAAEWWRFEPTFRPDCVLLGDRVVVVVVAVGRRLAAASDWYPPRTVLARGLEAAWRLAAPPDERGEPRERGEPGEPRARAWGVLAIGEQPLAAADDDAVRGSLAAGAPHLAAAERESLAGGYLGQLTWSAAARAVEPAGSTSP